jgi:hypothetical protein
MLRSRLESILNGDPAASLTRRRAQTWCFLLVSPYAPEGAPPVFTRCGLDWPVPIILGYQSHKLDRLLDGVIQLLARRVFFDQIGVGPILLG